MSVSLLVVEDKDKTLEQVLELLAPLKFSITTAKDGLDGLSKAKSDVYDMVLVDHKMPVMDGLNLVKSLRQLTHYKKIPIFFMTTQELADVEPVAVKTGVTECFSKPLNADRLIDAVKLSVPRSVA